MESYLTAREAAQLLKIALQTIYNLVQQGRLDAHRIGRDLRFDRDHLERFLWRRTLVDEQDAAIIVGLEPDDAFHRAYAFLRKTAARAGEKGVTLERLDGWQTLTTDPMRAGIRSGRLLDIRSLTDRAEAMAAGIDGRVWGCGLCPEGKRYAVGTRCAACDCPMCLACSRPDTLSTRRTVFGADRICRECAPRRSVRQPSPVKTTEAIPHPRSLSEDGGGTDRLVRPIMVPGTRAPAVTRGRVRGSLRRTRLYGDSRSA